MPAPEPRQPAIRVMLLPRDTNEAGTIFGGVILSHLDLAAAVECRKHGVRRYVTAAMKEVEFVAPVYVGDLVSFYARTVKVGTTSITVHVDVEAERRVDGRKVKVTEADVVYVAVDENGKPTPVNR
ncbi:MAG TPA: acyl-CoA thioesterase [Planctomycetota bacterium]|nr:acyl-CoA thioesterase [Planctomycetota bacterium]